MAYVTVLSAGKAVAVSPRRAGGVILKRLDKDTLMRRIAIAAALIALAGCATDPSADVAGRDCFRSEQVNGYTVIDDSHIGLTVGAGRNYVLTTMWNARDLDWTQAIAIRSTTGWICTGNGLGVQLIGGDPQRTYEIVSIERGPEEPAVQGS